MFFGPPPPPPAPPIIIWVHGTRPSKILPFLEDSPQMQAAIDATIQSPAGLHALSSIPKENATRELLEALSESDPHQFPQEAMYTFGWSGDLHDDARLKASRELFDQLKFLVEQYEKDYGVSPPITMFCHSHGGNVALLMALFANNELPFIIEKLIFLGIPVQKRTAQLTNHPLFNKIRSLHSHIDFVQIIDPQRLHLFKHAYNLWKKTKSFNHLKDAYFHSINHPFFSERHFPINSKVIQVNLYWKDNPTCSLDKKSYRFELFLNKVINFLSPQKRGVLHTEFITPHFITKVPTILSQINHYLLAKNPITHDIEITI